MICHTHWDREWYLSKEQFRSKMVRLIDSVLEAVETFPEDFTFMLDGQTIILQDYMEIRPENFQRLKRAISNGRISVGPWYILPDELLISGESHIRNYLTGQKLAIQYGTPMQIAYLPDSFGHPEQMPQIIEGLSMDTIVFWRGADEHMLTTEFRWQSPYKASEILGIHMPYGYGNSTRLNSDMVQTIPRINSMMNTLASRSHRNIVLLMNGSDHILNQKDILEIIDTYNKQNNEEKYIRLSSLQSYLDDLIPNLPVLHVHKGEIRSGNQSMLLSGTMSTRVYLKQWNTEVQRIMERYLEPLKSLEFFLDGKSDFYGYQNYLWQKILENHAHDSICGCSIDEVHAEMLTRFNSINQLQESLIKDTMCSLTSPIHSDAETNKVQFLYFEPNQDQLPIYTEVIVDFDPMLVKQVNFDKSIIDEYEDKIVHPTCPSAVRAFDENGNSIQAELLSAEKDYLMYLQDSTAPEIYKVNRCRVALTLTSSSYGLHKITLEPLEKKVENQQTRIVEEQSCFIENAFYRIEPDGNGAFRVTDRITGRQYNGVARLIDQGDAGDEYTYSWPSDDSVYELRESDIKIEKTNVSDMFQKPTLHGALHLPLKLDENRVARSQTMIECPLVIEASLQKDSPIISFEISIENHAKDHRLQIEFPSGEKTDKTWSSSAFSITEHENKLAIPESWMEYPFPTRPTHGFIATTTHQGGICLVADGLMEYEANNDTEQTSLRLTLLRCVGWLSRPDLNSRVGNGGWELETPSAQCLDTHKFRLGLCILAHEWFKSIGFAHADRFLHRPLFQQLMPSISEISNPLAFISQLPSNVRLSACKPSEDMKGVVLRVYSISDKTEDVSLKLPLLIKKVYQCNFIEQDRKAAYFSNQRLQFSIEPWQISSFYFELL